MTDMADPITIKKYPNRSLYDTSQSKYISMSDLRQYVLNDIVFEVDDTPEGDNLVTNFIGQRVKVTGNLIIDGDMRIIAVKSFKIVKE